MSQIDAATHVWVGFAECGCWNAVTVDLGFCGGQKAKETAKDVADYIKRGYRVERIALTEWRDASFPKPITKCPHQKEAR